MPKVLLGLSAALFLAASAFAQAPDPADSVILESKTIAPQAGACQSAILKIRVYVTNKDSLGNITLPLEERTDGGGYAILSRPASCASNRNSANVFTFLYPTAPGSGTPRLGTRIASYQFYHSSPPDTFMFTGTFDPTDPDTKLPSNLTRTPLLEIKFDSVTTTAPPGVGKFELDSGKISANVVNFVDAFGNTIRVNFVKSVNIVGVPLEFNLISPANGAFVPSQQPTFVWESLHDSLPIPAAYTVFVSTSPSFSPADTSPPLADTTWQIPTNLQFQTDYYWKVRAITTAPDTFFSNEERTFRVDAAPTTPIPIYPSINADISMNDFLVWLEATDPDPGDSVTYQVQIDDNPDFSTPEVDQGGIDENTQPPPLGGAQSPPEAASANAIAVQLKVLTDHDNLKDDSLYYWRVRTVDNHGAASPYSGGGRRFYLNLADSSPHTPEPVSPIGGVVLIDHRPDFLWKSTTDPDFDDPPSSLEYNVRLDTDGEVVIDFLFSFAIAPGETTFTILDSLPENSHWFWGVRAIDTKGARSTFSAVQNFYVNAVNEPPPAFSLISPPDGELIFPKTPTLDWDDAIDPDPLDSTGYVVAIDSFADFHTAFTSSPLFANSFSVGAGVLKRGVGYFWKVTATDQNSVSTPSNEVFQFRVLQLGDANKDGILSPADAVLIINFVFLGDSPIDPPELVDMNCNGIADPADIVIALNAIFLGQPPPCDP